MQLDPLHRDVCPAQPALARALSEEAEGALEPLADHLDSCTTCRGFLDRFQVEVLCRFGDRPQLNEPSDAVQRVIRALRPARCATPTTNAPLSDSAADADNATASRSGAGASLLHAHPEQIGRYRIVEPVGEGGMGVVYHAEQQSPIRRKVALKLIKLGMDTREVIARFESERQALALIDHPNVAKVHDAGATDAGRPYFVMEFVEGEPITGHCDRHRLSVRERLELFVQVCEAVQHAHGKGIIHRDIKPSNVLVARHGEQPLPKVIDFGVAKATEQRLTERTLFTGSGRLIGTPEYMSPEQADASGHVDVDTRADVYSLGVLLYELLSGALPFDPESLRRTSYGEMQRIIREVDPPPPSVRSTEDGSLAAVTAAARGTEPKHLVKLLRGDLDWIVLKAMEKDRARRYETAHALAADVERHLRDEPVLATPPSARYRLQKFVKRHRTGVIAGSAVATVLLLGVAGTLAGLVWALRERDRADARTVVAQRVSNFMGEMMRGIGPAVARGRETPVLSEIVDKAAARIERGQLRDAPRAELELRLKIGLVYLELDQFDAAERLLAPTLDQARALARAEGRADTNELAQALNAWGCLLAECGRADEGQPFLEQALAMYQRLQPADDPSVLAALHSLGTAHQLQGRFEKAESLLREALEQSRRLYDEDHVQVLGAMQHLAICLRYLRPIESIAICERLLAVRQRLYPDGPHPFVADALHEYATSLCNAGRVEEAIPVAEQALRMRRALFPGDHHQLANSIKNLAIARHLSGDHADAERLFEDALAMYRRLFTGDSALVAEALSQLGVFRLTQGRAADAEPLLREAVEMQRRLFGGSHRFNLAKYLQDLSSVLRELGRFDEAEQLARESLERFGTPLPDHAAVANGLAQMGTTLMRQKRPAEAEEFLVKALAMERRLNAADHPLIARGLSNLASARLGLNRPEDAEPLMEESLAMRRRLFRDADNPDLVIAYINLARVRAQLGRFDSAIADAEAALAMVQRIHPEPTYMRARILWRVAQVYLAAGDRDSAKPRAEQAVEMASKLLRADHPDLAEYRATLAECVAIGTPVNSGFTANGKGD